MPGLETVLKSAIYAPVAVHSDTEYVRASLRWKFQKRPLVDAKQQYQLDRSSTKGASSTDRRNFKASGTQTDYRESDAQTGPFSPELQIQDPQLLALSEVKSLPQTDTEFEFIRMLLMRQQKQQDLPADPKMKYAVLKEMEVEDAKQRAKIHSEQVERKISLLQQKLRDKQEARREEVARRLEHFEKQRSAAIDEVRRKIDVRRTRFLNGLAHRKTVVAQSELMEQLNSFTTMMSARTSYREEPKDDIDMVAEPLMVDIDLKLAQSSQDITPVNRLVEASPSSYNALKEKRWNKRLINIETSAEKVQKPRWEPRFLKPRKKEDTKPNTVSMDFTEGGSRPVPSRVDVLVICVQRVLRGLFDHRVMNEGVENRRELLEELTVRRQVGTIASLDQLSASLADVSSPMQSKRTAAKPSTLAEGQTEGADDLMGINEMELAQEFEDNIFAPYIGRVLPFLTSDLTRQREMARIKQEIDAALDHRNQLERIELEKRASELRNRQISEFIYGEIQRSHQTTVGSVLESVRNQSVMESASDTAIGLAADKHTELEQESAEIEKSSEEKVIKDLMESAKQQVISFWKQNEETRGKSAKNAVETFIKDLIQN